MRKLAFLVLPVLLLSGAGRLLGGPRTGTFKMSMPGYSTQIFVTVPSNYKKSQSAKWGLLVGLHGAGQPPGSYLGAWSSRLLGGAGYIMVSPQSCTGGGVWNIDGKGDNAKECEYILKIVEKLLKEYDLNPGMIHVNGFSAGSAMCAVGVAGDSSFRKFRQKSFVGFSGGFSGKMGANSDKAKETKVRVYNGRSDMGHKAPSRNMYQAFKDAGYDAEHFEVAGGHNYPLVSHRDIINWYVKLDKPARRKGEYVKLASQAQKVLADRDYAEAQKLFEKLQKAAGEDFPELAGKAKAGLAEIEKASEAAMGKMEELKAAGKEEELTDFCKQVMKDFAKTPVSEQAKKMLKERSKSSPAVKPGPAGEKPVEGEKPQEPAEETAGSLLAKAKRCIENEAYESASRYLEKILEEFPGAREVEEARRLLESIEDEL